MVYEITLIYCIQSVFALEAEGASVFITSELRLYFDYRQKPPLLLRLQQVQDLEATVPSKSNHWSLRNKNLPHYLPIFLIIRELKGKVMVRIPNDLPCSK